jgi:alanyl-tRNA synthetase
VSGSVRVLSVLPHELPAAIGRLHDEGRELRKMLARAQGRLAQFEGERLAHEAEPIGNMRLVAKVIEGWDAAGLKMLASAVAGQDDALAILVSAARPASVVIARGAGVPIDAGGLLQALATKFGGRGGGKADIAQGGGFDADAETIVSAARDLVSAPDP